VKNIILFASGGGSNVKAILAFYKNNDKVHFPIIVTNNSNAGVIAIAENFGIDVVLINKTFFLHPDFIALLKSYEPNLIVLAGFLWKIPPALVQSFPQKIINIHPALLPKYGGKGMYGHHVHEAVVKNAEKESGITIHYVNEQYDDGAIIMQKETAIELCDSAVDVSKKVLALEHQYYSLAIEALLE
jgi:phosphoribosylglycinamide formyltransferase 1